MTDTLTTFLLAGLTLLTLAAWALALHRLRQPGEHAIASTAQQTLVIITGLAAAGLFLHRWLFVEGAWQPLTAHVDGLLLIATLFAGTVAFLQSRPRLLGLSVFGLPLLALILAWALCAATWTYRPFEIDTLHPVWRGLHLAGVYLGTLGSAVAAIAGGMYLYVQHRLKHKQAPAQFGRLASLEALENLIIRTATLGFALLTLGLVAGLVILIDEPDAWEHASLARYLPKIVLATLAWLSFAVVMNVRYAASFRGRRAAWLAIAGLVLLLAVYGIVTSSAFAPRAAAGGVSSFEFRVSSFPSGERLAQHRAQGHQPENSKRETRNQKLLKPEVSTCAS